MSASGREGRATRQSKHSSTPRGHKTKPSRPARSPVDQISLLQRTIGNRAVARLLKFGVVRAKLKVNEPGDIYEQEADRISGQVLAAPTQTVAGKAPRIQRVAGQLAGEAAPAPAGVEDVLAGAGRPLEPALRLEMEQRFGWDFSRVRVHLGPMAEQSARDVNARAYTVGDNLVFGAGEFKPETLAGRRLLAHELTHVVQQSGAEANVVRRQFDDDEPTLVEGSSSRGTPRGHVERGGERFPGNTASGEIEQVPHEGRPRAEAAVAAAVRQPGWKQRPPRPK